jgi:hypothetical protein
VVILSDGARTIGRLQVTEEGRETDSRRVSGASCAEVVEALSLTAALSVDPDALLAAPPPSPPPAPPAPATAPEPRPLPPPPPPRPRPKTLHWWVGADVVGSTALSPGVLWGGGVSFGFEQTRPGVLAPSVRLTLRHLRNDVLEEQKNAIATWSTLGIDACPLRLGRALSLQPCAAARTGLLYLGGRGVDHPTSVDRPWWSLGGVLRLRAAVGPTWSLEVAGGLEGPLVGRRFVVEAPRREVAHTPPAVVTGSLGVAARLP